MAFTYGFSVEELQGNQERNDGEILYNKIKEVIDTERYIKMIVSDKWKQFTKIFKKKRAEIHFFLIQQDPHIEVEIV